MKPIQPLDMQNRYASRTAAQKLGIKPSTTVAFINPPRQVENTIGALPPEVEVVEDKAAVTLCFVHSADRLKADMSRLRDLAGETKLWFAWRKKSASPRDEVTGDLVRLTGIDLGLVDYKICSIDQTWSAMLFAARKI